MNLQEKIAGLCVKAKTASYSLALAKDSERSGALRILSEKLRRPEITGKIIAANDSDISYAKENNLTAALIDRLKLDETRINNIADALLKIINLPDPLNRGEVWTRPNGMNIKKIKVPLGVIGIIYESRPNVTIDAAALCIKSGNAVVLRGGKEAIFSNTVLAELIKSALSEAGLDPDCVQFIDDITRESANILMKQRGSVDVLIPRGNAPLINSVAENSNIPVIETGVGNCHIYVDDSADFDEAAHIILKSKTRSSVCNAVETVLVSQKIYKDFLPVMKRRLDELSVELRGCEKTCEILSCAAAEDEDYYTEFLDYILSVKIVEGLDAAVEHINKYNTGHSEAILTQNLNNAREFCERVNAAAVYVNVSTRFTDGEEFGFGAEMGISTSKLHARGPVGPADLTTVKYIIDGDNLVR
ncbi:MAG: glutamate-5-semialdehyde dehydrogenase [Oscillospiraceae bacterium]|nr:glutamate-5-semialdehyde dehydrogenase [Oscillospiraceae bacterium]